MKSVLALTSGLRLLKLFTGMAWLSLVSVGSVFAQGEGKLEAPIWAKHAIAIGNCFGQAHPEIPSPDRKSTVQAQCRPPKIKGDDPVLYLRVRTRSGKLHSVGVQEGAHEVLWSPDSTAFFVNGGTSSYAGFFLTVNLVNDDSVTKVSLTSSAQRDMVRTFPPCKAFNRDETTCKSIEAHPEFNMSGLAWVERSSAIIVMAEIPCSSSYGGVMCAVQGYQLKVPTGTIEKRISARQLKAHWQKAMAWDMGIPDPPRYGPPRGRTGSGFTLASLSGIGVF